MNDIEVWVQKVFANLKFILSMNHTDEQTRLQSKQSRTAAQKKYILCYIVLFLHPNCLIPAFLDVSMSILDWLYCYRIMRSLMGVIQNDNFHSGFS